MKTNAKLNVHRFKPHFVLAALALLLTLLLSGCHAPQETQAELLPGEDPAFWLFPSDTEFTYIQLWLSRQQPSESIILHDKEVDAKALADILSGLRLLTAEETESLTEMKRAEGESFSLSVRIEGKGSFDFLTGTNAMVAAITPAPGIVCRDKFKAYACAPNTYERLRALFDAAE